MTHDTGSPTRVDSVSPHQEAEGFPRATHREAVELLSILHVHQKTSLSTGSVHQMIQAAAGLHDRGHRVLVVTRDSPLLREHLEDLGVGMRGLPFRNLVDLRTGFGLRQIIRSERPDVIHVHKGLAHWLTLLALVGDPFPVLIANRGVSFPLTLMNRGKYRSPRTDRIITVCEAVKRVIEKSGRIDGRKIDVVYAATDMERFDRSRVHPRAFRHREGIPADAFVFLQSGTRVWKGWEAVVDAFREVRSVLPDSRLVIAGHDGDLRESQVRSRVEKAGLTTCTHILGYRADIEEVIAAADVVVDASWDGTGITGTVREAMALGVPVIATDCGGNRELLSHPDLGWLIERRNHAQLVSAMIEAASDPVKRQRIAGFAERVVRERFSIPRRIDRLESVYLSAVRARRQRHPLPVAGDERASLSG